jgi:hypothetical protein
VHDWKPLQPKSKIKKQHQLGVNTPHDAALVSSTVIIHASSPIQEY